MVDPLADVVAMLRPTARQMKIATASGPWRVSRSESGGTFYCAVLEGRSRLAVAGRAPIDLETGDFVLMPAAADFVASSRVPPRGTKDSPFVVLPGGHVRHGPEDAPIDTRLAIGHGAFESTDAALLVSLLPELVHVRGEPRLATLLSFVRDESRTKRPGRDMILTRLLEVVLIEALRSAGTNASPGLLRGLADERVAVALRLVHANPETAWSVERLAKEAGVSRSVFFDRFVRAVGIAPMHYLLGWRMALAKRDLAQGGASVGEIATRVGYGSASAFSVAFTRHVGEPPSVYARARVSNAELAPRADG